MAEQPNIPPAPEVAKTEQPAKPEQKTEAKTIDEVLGEPAKAKEETVPLSAFLELKNSSKAEIRELRQLIKEGASKNEVTAEIKAIAEKHGTEPEFIRDILALHKEGTKKAEPEPEEPAKKSSDDKPDPEKAKAMAKERTERFNAHLERTLEEMPEYKGIVSKEAVRALSLLPENGNKTLPKIIEESFGHLVAGKGSIDKGGSRASKDDGGEVDYARADKDPEYFAQVMASPERKAKFNKRMMDQLGSRI